MQKTYQEKIDQLYQEVGRLTTELTWLKKNLATTMPRNDRVRLIDWQDPDWPIQKQAEVLSLNRSGLYYQPVSPSPRELALRKRMDELYTRYPFYGSRRMAAQLNHEGLAVNRKAVRRLMRQMGIEGIHPGPNLSKRDKRAHIYPYLLRGLAITHSNQV